MPSGKYPRLQRKVPLVFDLVTAARLQRAAEADGTTVAAMLEHWVQHNIEGIDPAPDAGSAE